jgi:hypothetical protein
VVLKHILLIITLLFEYFIFSLQSVFIKLFFIFLFTSLVCRVSLLGEGGGECCNITPVRLHSVILAIRQDRDIYISRLTHLEIYTCGIYPFLSSQLCALECRDFVFFFSQRGAENLGNERVQVFLISVVHVWYSC